MKSIRLVLMGFTAVGVLAEPQSNASYQSNSFNYYSKGYGSSLQSLSEQIQTSAVENPTAAFPSIISPSTASEAYHCLETLIRPQFRNEIITVPTVDNVVGTIPGSPVVETINCGETTRLTTFNPRNGVQTKSRNLPNGGRGSSNYPPRTYANAFFEDGRTERPALSMATMPQRPTICTRRNANVHF